VNQHFCVQADDIGVELDEYLCRVFPLLRKRDLRALVRDGSVTVNGMPSSPSQRRASRRSCSTRTSTCS
jgi:hypothetical protein